MHWSTRLGRLRACDDGAAWAAQFPDAKIAWNSCPRSDWLMWFLARDAATLGSRQRIVAINAALMRSALQIAPSEARELQSLLDRAAVLKSFTGDFAEVRAAEVRWTGAQQLVPAALAAGTAWVVHLARRAHDANDDERRLRWTQAATRPSGFLALAHSNAAFAQSGDPTQAQAAAVRALQAAADTVRALVPADAVPVSLYHPA